ncbi:MAG: DUF1318 domain-containing protein [Spirochaetes bacterium]|jgi:hypothetical protein|nr:DUF1318 domain-containing protein [Spirochaetota bacterium]
MRSGYLIIIILLASCSTIVPPKMYITGEKTLTESQVVGDYKEIEKDAWAISSVETHVQREASKNRSAIGDEEIFKAMKIREYHADVIREYKSEGVIGEANNGLVAYRPVEEYETDTDLRRIVRLVVEEENSARTTIFRRTLVLGGKASPTPFDIRTFGEKFAEEQRDAALEGDWIQNTSGNWFTKR